jgi:hypothetical protein
VSRYRCRCRYRQRRAAPRQIQGLTGAPTRDASGPRHSVTHPDRVSTAPAICLLPLHKTREHLAITRLRIQPGHRYRSKYYPTTTTSPINLAAYLGLLVDPLRGYRQRVLKLHLQVNISAEQAQFCTVL